MTDTYLPVGLNAVFCLAIIFVCICRSDKMTKGVLLRVKVQYVVMVMAAFTFAASPWLFDLPGWPSVFFSFAVLFMLVSDSYQWRGGPPPAATGPAPLGDI